MLSSPSKVERLLYRGALSLPDSHLLLDGLTFSARLDADQLINNPLALALESMRGRPTLRFIGTANLSQIYMDSSGEISLRFRDVHPLAVLSRVYFENMFLCAPFSPNKLGVKVALGDSDGPETTQMIIFAQDTANPGDADSQIRLAVARLTTEPPTIPKARLPRPDDPTPRKPPAVLVAKGRELRRIPSNNALASSSKRQKLDDGSAALLGSGVRLGSVAAEASTFKVPYVPSKLGTNPTRKEDVFGSADLEERRPVENKGKRKFVPSIEPLERDNKDCIKRTVVQQLKLSPITKQHPEYTPVFKQIYHGVEFAMRSIMKKQPVDPSEVSRLVKIHSDMYAI
ncbi:hypothetical protein C8J56DRAFT_767124 [Mycena floridula]|nr:hypothetical protein C8J56DRAFT_767124 [Mycena floridula]